jgi:hypothetical protein
MLKKNKEAKSIVESTQALIEETDKEFQSYDEHACENISKYAQLRQNILDGSVKEFEENYDAISNYDYIYKGVRFSDEELEDVRENFYEKAPTIEPIEVPHISSGGFSSIIIGLIWGIISIAAFIGAGIFMTKTKIDPNALPKTLDDALNVLNPIFVHFGNIIVPNHGTALHGMLLIGGVSVVVALLFGLSRYHARSTKNLHASQEALRKAEEQKELKKEQQKKIMSLCKYTQSVDETLYTLDLYLKEYNAVIKRILHTEGDNFEEFMDISKQKVQTAAILDRELLRLINTEIVTQNGELNPLNRYSLSMAQKRLEEIRNGELEVREDDDYVEEEYAHIEEETEELLTLQNDSETEETTEVEEGTETEEMTETEETAETEEVAETETTSKETQEQEEVKKEA